MERAWVIGRIARAQGGVVTREQALRAGYSRHEIDNLLTARRWRRLARATYAVVPSAPDLLERRRRIRAAVLSLGPDAHVVLATAAELQGMPAFRGRARSISHCPVVLPSRLVSRTPPWSCTSSNILSRR
ncbi:hypothetical protein ABZS44_03255 [Micromonospora sediminicola]|uniref:hypothetical protein n=1 Tax=Micromonospora sediminicola TaxID=946078 RepID=UPI0033A53A8A